MIINVLNIIIFTYKEGYEETFDNYDVPNGF